MEFGQAVEALRKGEIVRRLIWGEDKFIVAQIPAKISHENIDVIKSLPHKAKEIIKKNENGITYKSRILVVDKHNIASNWTPTSYDIFAVDWYVV